MSHRLHALIIFLIVGCAVAACGSGVGYGGSSTTMGPGGPPPPGSFALTLTAGPFGSLHASPAPTAGFYPAGTVVTLTATPVTGYQVGTWSGTDDDSVHTSTNQVTMNASKTVAVTFVLTHAPPVVHGDG